MYILMFPSSSLKTIDMRFLSEVKENVSRSSKETDLSLTLMEITDWPESINSYLFYLAKLTKDISSGEGPR
jgi:hypothetical protein